VWAGNATIGRLRPCFRAHWSPHYASKLVVCSRAERVMRLAFFDVLDSGYRFAELSTDVSVRKVPTVLVRNDFLLRMARTCLIPHYVSGSDVPPTVLSCREKLERREGRPHPEACFSRTVRKALLSTTLYVFIVTTLIHRIKLRTGLF